MLLSSSNQKYSPFPLLSYFSVVVCLRCLLLHILSLIAYTFRENRGICFHYYCAVYEECKYSDTFWLAGRTRLFVQYTISLSSLCKLIWRHWTYKMPVKIYFVACVSKITHIHSVIHYTICGAVCFQFTHFPCDDWENIYTSSYYHHQIGSMTITLCLGRVRSWNNGVRCMSLYILMGCRNCHIPCFRYKCIVKHVLNSLYRQFRSFKC